MYCMWMRSSWAVRSESQRDVVYLGWPVTNSAPRTRIWAQRLGEGGMRGFSQWVQLYTWSPNKLWRSNSDLTPYLTCGLDRLTAIAKVAKVLSSKPASSDTVKSEGRQMNQRWIKYFKKWIKILALWCMYVYVLQHTSPTLYKPSVQYRILYSFLNLFLAMF